MSSMSSEQKKNLIMISLFKTINNMNFFLISFHLSRLSIAKKLFIARAHVFMNFRRVKNCQYKYFEHVINFMQNIVKIIHRFFNLFSKLQMLVLKSFSSFAKENNVTMSFRETFRIRKKYVEIWLKFLIQNHSNYKAIFIDFEHFEQLFENDTIWDQFSNAEDSLKNDKTNIDKSNIVESDVESEKESELIEITCVFDLTINVAKLIHLKQQMKKIRLKINEMSFFMITFEFIFLNERDIFLHIERMTFFTLFSIDVATFNVSKQRSVSMLKYIHHLMRYKNQRFARHSQFRYWIFNIYMRNQICQINKWCIFRSKNKLIEFEELRELIAQNNNRLANIITKRIVNLREIRSYWMKCRFEFETMMKNLNCSHVFFICNAIDMQWHDFYKHMFDFELFQKNTNTKRERLSHRFLQKNSHIATKYFDRHFQLFFKHVLKKKFVVVNYWYRFKWQIRENDHVHDFFWFQNVLSFEQLEEFLFFWDFQATIINSAEEISFVFVHSCSKSFSQRNNILRELTKLLNRVQRHIKCFTAYCLRKIKDSKNAKIENSKSEPLKNSKILKFECRFHFSFSMKKIFAMIHIINSKWKSYDSSRNDSLLSIYNVIVFMNWLANIDFISCIDQHVVLEYIAKYYSKAKTKSLKLINVLREILSQISFFSKNLMLFLVIKMMNRLITKRDWFAQKICHHLLKRDLKQSSRIIQVINLFFIETQKRQFFLLEFENIKSDDIYLKKYCARLKKDVYLTLYEINKQYDWKNKVFRHKIRESKKILTLFSMYSCDFEHKFYEDYCKAKMMLHHSFVFI
jgi:hypothetical protein